jgi:hypothetical protein
VASLLPQHTPSYQFNTKQPAEIDLYSMSKGDLNTCIMGLLANFNSRDYGKLAQHTACDNTVNKG